MELNQYHWTDLQEDGRSLLPPGTMGAGEQAAIEIPGGLLIGYASKTGLTRRATTSATPPAICC